MRVLQITGSLLDPLGGAEQYCLELCRWLVAQGHTVTLAAGWVDDGVRERIERSGITIVGLGSRRPYPPDRKGGRFSRLLFHGLDVYRSIVPSRAMLRLCRAPEWDAIHVHRTTGIGTAVLGIRGVPVVHTVHDFSLVDTAATLVRDERVRAAPPVIQRLRIAVSNHSIGRATRLVYPSERTRDGHRDWGLTAGAENSVVIPHGWVLPAADSTDRSVAVPSSPRREGAGAPAVFLFMGKFIPSKGVELLLEAWGDGFGDAELWIAGAGPMAPAVERAAARASVRDLGWLDESQRSNALRAASVLVVPSLWPENFPLVVAEALLAGIPVLTTTTASPPLVVHGRSGLIAPPDAASLALAFAQLAENATLRDTLARGAGELAAQLDFDHHGRLLQSLYRDAS